MKYLLVVSMQCLMFEIFTYFTGKYIVSLYIKVEINGKINVRM
jgi:hypothetical protein